MQYKQQLLPGVFYHIYNRGNNGDNIFLEERNYDHFLSLWARHVEPVAETFAYCLLKNHFHILIKIREEEDIKLRMRMNPNSLSLSEYCSKQLSNCFNSYAKAINKGYNRTGSLFENRFERKRIENKKYLLNVISYLHQNPQKHGFTNDYRDWPHSSYKSHLSQKQTRLERASVHELFGSKEKFIHAQNQKLILEDVFEDLVCEKII